MSGLAMPHWLIQGPTSNTNISNIFECWAPNNYCLTLDIPFDQQRHRDQCEGGVRDDDGQRGSFFIYTGLYLKTRWKVNYWRKYALR